MPEKESTVNDLTAFGFHGHTVRVVTDQHGEPLFILADLCRVLDLSSPTRVAERLDPDALSLAQVTDSLGRPQQAHAVTEAGMYETVIRSDKPQARDFRRWVTTEVLPSIRKTGQYGVVSHITKSDLARMVLDSEAAREAAEQRVAELEPPARAWEALADSTGDYSMRDAAQILARDPGIDIGQNRLAKYLREIGWVDARGIPYQAHVDLGRITSKPQTRVSARTGERVVCDPQTRITLKGLGDLHRRLNGTAPLDTTARHLAAVPA